MENHNSCDKLVALEAGLATPELPRNFVFNKKVKRRSNQCTNIFLGILATSLLVVVSYEIWQSVRSERLIIELENQNSIIDERKAAPLIPDYTKIDDMAEELRKLKNTLNEMQEKIKQQQITTTEIPLVKIVETKIDHTTEKPTSSIIEETDSISDSVIMEPLDIPAIFTNEGDFEQSLDLENVSEQLVPAILVAEPAILENTGNGWFWSFSINFGGGAEEEPDVGESEELEGVSTTEGVATTENYEEEIANLPIDETSAPNWWVSWLNGKDETTENVIDDEITTEKPLTVEPIVVPFPLTGNDYYYDSYEYPSDADDDDDDYYEETTSATSQSHLELEAATESYATSGSTASRDEQEVELPVTTESRDSSTDVFNSQIEFGTPSSRSSSEAEEEKPEKSIGETSERLDELLAELEEQQNELLKSLRYASEMNQGFDDSFPSSNQEDESWRSYISKRSINTEPSFAENEAKHLTDKELGHKISIIEQAIDNDNHLIQNELSLTSGPSKEILRAKLNRFYAKMEAVSAHIDRLHEKYMRLNKLEDDYVSREFPSQ